MLLHTRGNSRFLLLLIQTDGHPRKKALKAKYARTTAGSQQRGLANMKFTTLLYEGSEVLLLLHCCAREVEEMKCVCQHGLNCQGKIRSAMFSVFASTFQKLGGAARSGGRNTRVRSFDSSSFKHFPTSEHAQNADNCAHQVFGEHGRARNKYLL